MSKARKLKSGKWNIQVFIGRDDSGKTKQKSFTADTKAEVQLLAAEFVKALKEGRVITDSGTVGEAIDKYIELSSLLSPTTIRGYQQVRKNQFPHLMNVQVAELDDLKMQKAINEESKRISPTTHKPLSAKSVHNSYGLIEASIKKIYGKTFNVRLPRIEHHFVELPPAMPVLEAIRGTSVELPCLLALWTSLRLSEVRGIRCSSIRSGRLYVEQVILKVGSEHVVRSHAKTATSHRSHRIPQYIMDLIMQEPAYQEYLLTGKDSFLIQLTDSQIYHRFVKCREEAGLDITFHDLRHMFASISLNVLNLPMKVVQIEGGWGNQQTMNNIYNNAIHGIQDEADDIRDEYFEGLLRKV